MTRSIYCDNLGDLYVSETVSQSLCSLFLSLSSNAEWVRLLLSLPRAISTHWHHIQQSYISVVYSLFSCTLTALPTKNRPKPSHTESAPYQASSFCRYRRQWWQIHRMCCFSGSQKRRWNVMSRMELHDTNVSAWDPAMFTQQLVTTNPMANWLAGNLVRNAVII